MDDRRRMGVTLPVEIDEAVLKESHEDRRGDDTEGVQELQEEPAEVQLFVRALCEKGPLLRVP